MSGAIRDVFLGRLSPSPDEPGAEVARRVRILLIFSLTLANLAGAAVVALFLAFVLPVPEEVGDFPLLVNAIVAGAYVAIAIVLGAIWGIARLRPMYEWLHSDQRGTTEAQRVFVLRAPMRIFGIHAALWAPAAILFGVLNWTYSSELGLRVGGTVLIAGITTGATAYLFTERGLRPVAARALAEGIGERRIGPGVRARGMLGWVLGTGIPVVGVMAVALSTLVEHDFSAEQLARTVLALGVGALTVGAFLSTLAARSVGDPVREVSRAMADVEAGELDVAVPVYDGSEVGQLQSGFNRMVAGMRERERVRDLFGRHVGEDVARAALAGGVELGGETRDVTVLFVDLVGSATLAAQRRPQEVVEVLNRFFGVVVDVVRRHGGWINKFEGDAALAVFGAPVLLPDHAARGLACAREMSRRLSAEVQGVRAGIGVSTGEVVAGNIGEERRFEYTVIGDPVNEAARLTELAKTRGGVLASESAVDASDAREQRHWNLGEAVTLRGRTRETRLATPR